ncbi:MAG: site-2 protease family protein [Longimicrobiales bacterium]
MEVLLLVPVLLFSFVVHEYAHAWVARREGDPTAEQLGRITLNPLAHIDLFGTIIIPVMLLVTKAGFIIGWAKPVPIVPANFLRGRKSQVLVAVAGVTANLALALALTVVVIGLTYAERALPDVAFIRLLRTMAEGGIFLNFLLVVFNLMPLPPLDGWTVLQNLLPVRIATAVQKFQTLAVLVFLAMFLTGTFTFVMKPAILLHQLSRTVIQWST